MTCSWWMRLIGFCLLGVTAIPLLAEQRNAMGEPGQVKVIDLKATNGQILSYGHLSRSTEVWMAGTRLAGEAAIKLKVQSRPGFVEIDINRGNIVGLESAHQFGKDFLTYVLWAVSVDGKASNLGEITFLGGRPISVNVTTPYQTFWLMVTAEPDFAVVDPSPQVVLYSANENPSKEQSEKNALPIKGDLFFYTHYTDYDSVSGAVGPGPNELLQARKAVELASKSGILALERPAGTPEVKEEKHTRETLRRAKTFLAQAEDAYKENPEGSNVVQFARTAAQIAENARALALGAVGGTLIRQLENDVARLRAELEEVRDALSKAQAELPEDTPKLSTAQGDVPPLSQPSPTSALAKIVSSPTVWFGLIGWALALLLLLRRQST